MATDRRPEFFKGGQLKVAIIGCGYVGLPLALRFAEAGHKVTGFDTDPEKVRMLNAGKSYIEHIQQTKIQQFVNSRHFNAVTDFSKLAEADAIIICVPTPLNEYREPDLSYVETRRSPFNRTSSAGNWSFSNPPPIPAPPRNSSSRFWNRAASVAPSLTGPENENMPLDFFLAFSPEREDPGNKQYGLAQIPKVVGGINPPSGPRGDFSLRSGRCSCRSRQHYSRRGNGQATRKHLPMRQHRSGQRTETSLPAHGRGRLGSDRRRLHQALRLHAVLSGAWTRRPLHPGGPVLSFLESARV